MQDKPAGVTETMLVTALREGWGIEVHEIAYRPVGAGGYHWQVGDRWFLTVTAAEPAPLERALRTARALHDDAGLGFVLAAEPAANGSPLRPVGPRHTLSVFPLVEGESGDFGPHCEDRAEVVDMLAALHHATPHVRDLAPPDDLRLRGRDTLAGPFPTAGPYAEPARDLLAAHAGKIGRWLSELDRLAAQIAPVPRVVTHGEPHPANILTTATGKLLIDWDTVRIAPPERDVWHLTDDPFADADPAGDEALTRYAETTGHRISAAALGFYRLTWILADIAGYAADLRAPHAEGGDAAEALAELRGYLEK